MKALYEILKAESEMMLMDLNEVETVEAKEEGLVVVSMKSGMHHYVYGHSIMAALAEAKIGTMFIQKEAEEAAQ